MSLASHAYQVRLMCVCSHELVCARAQQSMCCVADPSDNTALWHQEMSLESCQRSSERKRGWERWMERTAGANKKKENNCNHGRRNVGGSKEGGIREEMHKEWTLVMERRRKGSRVRERGRERETDSCSSAEAYLKKKNSFWAFVNSRALSHDLLRQKSKGRQL